MGGCCVGVSISTRMEGGGPKSGPYCHETLAMTLHGLRKPVALLLFTPVVFALLGGPSRAAAPTEAELRADWLRQAELRGRGRLDTAPVTPEVDAARRLRRHQGRQVGVPHGGGGQSVVAGRLGTAHPAGSDPGLQSLRRVCRPGVAADGAALGRRHGVAAGVSARRRHLLRAPGRPAADGSSGRRDRPLGPAPIARQGVLASRRGGDLSLGHPLRNERCPGPARHAEQYESLVRRLAGRRGHDVR